VSFRGILKASLVSAVVLGSFAQLSAAQAESLADAMRAAYRKNPTLNADRARQRGTDELVPAAKSGWRPSVTATGTVQRQWTGTTKVTTLFGTSGGNDAVSSAAVRIELSQPVFRGFRTVEGVKSAKATVEAGRQQLLSTEQGVLLDVASAYLSVNRDRQIVAIRQKNVSNLRKQLRGAQARFDAGEVTRTDVAQSRSRVSGAEGNVAAANSDLQSSIAAYVAAVGHKPGKLKYSRLGKLPHSLESALATAQEINPQILAASWVYDATQHDVKVAKGALLPTIDLQASASYSATDNDGDGPVRSATVLGVLNVPIYQSGREYAAIRQAKQTASQRQIEIIEATRAVRRQVTSAWYALQASREAIVSAKSQVSAAELALDGIQQEYQVGSRTTIDVLNAEQEVLTARIGLVNAEFSEKLSSYQLLQAMGKLTAKHLGLGGTYYDPKRNYNRVKNKWIGTGIGDD
jgi:outer membrane protein